MTVVVNTGLLVANLIVFGLSLKLYTEILKDASQTRRKLHNDGSVCGSAGALDPTGSHAEEV